MLVAMILSASDGLQCSLGLQPQGATVLRALPEPGLLLSAHKAAAAQDLQLIDPWHVCLSGCSLTLVLVLANGLTNLDAGTGLAADTRELA